MTPQDQTKAEHTNICLRAIEYLQTFSAHAEINSEHNQNADKLAKELDASLEKLGFKEPLPF